MEMGNDVIALDEVVLNMCKHLGTLANGSRESHMDAVPRSLERIADALDHIAYGGYNPRDGAFERGVSTRLDSVSAVIDVSTTRIRDELVGLYENTSDIATSTGTTDTQFIEENLSEIKEVLEKFLSAVKSEVRWNWQNL